MVVQVELKPVDQHQGPHIPVPLGKTTIGRGPFLRCPDKKVSRNHAVLELAEDGSLTITSTHVNPCYYTAEANGTPWELVQDVPQQLHHGDKFSLLPSTYIYEVVALSKPVDAMNNGVIEEKVKVELSKEENTNAVKETEMETDAGLAPNGTDLVNQPSSKEKMDTESEDVPSCETKTEEKSDRKRTLPDWLLEVTNTLSGSDHKKTKGPRKMGRTRNASDDHTEASTSRTVAARGRSTRVKKQINYYAADEDDSDNEDWASKRRGSARGSRDDDPDYGYGSSKRQRFSDDDSDEAPSRRRRRSSNVGTKRRKTCLYGEKCFRKNQAHFKSYSHPGDSDYELDADEEDGDDSEKQECEFGLNCYRRNPKHRKEFKHTKRTRPQREAAKLARYKQKNADGDSDDDENFLDDESDEYKPNDSEDDSDEDVGRLDKEAKQFVGNKRAYKIPK